MIQLAQLQADNFITAVMRFPWQHDDRGVVTRGLASELHFIQSKLTGLASSIPLAVKRVPGEVQLLALY